MEALYKKLYEKYTKLKTRKETEIEQLNREQEVKFLTYVSADELIEHLRNENGKLLEQVAELRSEVASIRSTKDEEYSKYQNILMEENQKNKELSEEIERLRNLQRVGLCYSSKIDKNENGQLSTPGVAQVGRVDTSNASAISMARKRRRRSGPEEKEGASSQSVSGQVVLSRERESAKDLSKETLSSGILVDVQQAGCCRRNIDSSGDDINDTSPASCLFQALVEFLVGMKLSAVREPDGKCISALHQSSGYSFSLTWVNKAAGEEMELLYRVQSLGTFERVAPGWMRDVLMFSTNMCPVFFERVSRVIKLHP
ncbi:uncharacterized protein LOC100854476 isoform X3 [Vitis vinifera]|uniref:uncharacterized protein LOC100854476 isoform X3 n=1 Tax=Vitis vinifera TaxID=29760 RepID=UPI0028834031|nr:uncharacterized protein LOC100854476 isoform X3 [Vitis vinifera]XP_059593604.1 uncharacterized protein LOC100854476 isoform X3 [Vitis vinifera]